MILEIYCDASIKTDPRTGEYIGCPGAIAVFDGKIIDTIVSVRYGYTNNRSELTALLHALELLNIYRDQYDRINIYSDSLLCVKTFKEWIYNWVKTVPMISSSNTPVMNQDLILYMLLYIVYNNLKVNLYHIRGHINSDKDIDRAYKTFIKTNGIKTSLDDIRRFCEFNNYIDNCTRNTLNSTNEYEPYLQYPAFYVPGRENMILYSRLMNHYGE